MLNQAQANVEAVMGEDAVLGAARLRQPFASPQGEGLAPRRGQSRKRRGEGQEDGLIRRPSRGRHTGFRACTSPSSASPWIQRQPLKLSIKDMLPLRARLYLSSNIHAFTH